MKIAVDAMGGDYAPKVLVHGGVEAARVSRGRFEVVFVGHQDQIERELARYFWINDLKLSIHHASEKIEMNESPAQALKRKRDSSIAVATRLHQEGKVDAVVSAGNTGAALASALFKLGRLKGVVRPAIASFIPHERGVCLVIDVGTNVDCKPIQLLQFGVMGSLFMSRIYDRENPLVGLLSIGEEDNKGNELTLKAHKLLKKAPINFVGNIEGGDILRGKVDVVVCDGFVGNILLKFTEAIDGLYSSNLRRKIGKKIFSQLGAFLLKPTFARLRKIFDYAEYGGVPLLGINGVCIICHGGSSPKAIKNAILEAEKMVNGKVNEHIAGKLETIKWSES